MLCYYFMVKADISFVIERVSCLMRKLYRFDIRENKMVSGGCENVNLSVLRKRVRGL